MTKEQLKAKEEQVSNLVHAFCDKHLNDEYADLCETLIRKMGRKREVPFERGKPEIWAASVIYTIGTLNFLFDKSFLPYFSSSLKLLGQGCLRQLFKKAVKQAKKILEEYLKDK